MRFAGSYYFQTVIGQVVLVLFETPEDPALPRLDVGAEKLSIVFASTSNLTHLLFHLKEMPFAHR